MTLQSMVRKKLSLDTSSFFILCLCLYYLLLQVVYLIAFSASGFVVMLAGSFLLYDAFFLLSFAITRRSWVTLRCGTLSGCVVHIASAIDLLSQT